MIPDWLIIVAIVSLALALASAGYILYDLVVHKRKMMPVMKWVWPITALYMGPFAVWAYRSMGISDKQHGKGQPFWQVVFKGVTHCGGGCTLGDLIAEWGVFILAFEIVGIALWPEFIFDYLLAYILGILFQYFAIAPMRGLGLRDGLIAAIKADTLSLTAFEVGLFGWMALYSVGFFHFGLHPDSPVYWFMMQIGMVVGFATSYPMNWWLIRRGIKEAM